MKKNKENIEENVEVTLEEVKEERHDEKRIHVVGKHESLWHVALVELGHGSRYREIMNLNGMDTDGVCEGQILLIPDK